MGTNGIYVFVCNKKYYVFFKGVDSYPKGLGNLLVKEINMWTLEYIENLKQWILQMMIDENQSYCGFENITHSIKHSSKYCCYIRTIPPKFNEGGYEWIYTIDLDITQFSIEWIEYTTKNGDFKEWTRKQVFNLTDIPESWIDSLNIKDDE